MKGAGACCAGLNPLDPLFLLFKLMTELSPAAQAVLEAHDIGFSTPAICLAEALRALADQVVPEEPAPTGMRASVEMYTIPENQRRQRQETRSQILAIANELDNQ